MLFGNEIWSPCCCYLSQAHPFFRHINWDDLLARKVEPPFKPFLVSLSCAATSSVTCHCMKNNQPTSFGSNQLMMSASLTPSSLARLQWTALTTLRSAKVPIKSSWWVTSCLSPTKQSCCFVISNSEDSQSCSSVDKSCKEYVINTKALFCLQCNHTLKIKMKFLFNYIWNQNFLFYWYCIC